MPTESDWSTDLSTDLAPKPKAMAARQLLQLASPKSRLAERRKFSRRARSGWRVGGVWEGWVRWLGLRKSEMKYEIMI